MRKQVGQNSVSWLLYASPELGPQLGGQNNLKLPTGIESLFCGKLSPCLQQVLHFGADKLSNNCTYCTNCLSDKLSNSVNDESNGKPEHESNGKPERESDHKPDMESVDVAKYKPQLSAECITNCEPEREPDCCADE